MQLSVVSVFEGCKIFSPLYLVMPIKKQNSTWRYPHNRFSLHYYSYHSHLQGKCGVVLCLSRLVCEYYVAYIHISVITSRIRLGTQHHWMLKHCYFCVHARQLSASVLFCLQPAWISFAVMFLYLQLAGG